MKELNVHCNLYLELRDSEDVEEALGRLLMYIDPDVEINVHDYSVREVQEF